MSQRHWDAEGMPVANACPGLICKEDKHCLKCTLSLLSEPVSSPRAFPAALFQQHQILLPSGSFHANYGWLKDCAVTSCWSHRSEQEALIILQMDRVQLQGFGRSFRTHLWKMPLKKRTVISSQRQIRTFIWKCYILESRKIIKK